MSSQRVKFIYKNHRGEVAEREVEIISLVFRFDPNPEYGYQPGWFLQCNDYSYGRPGDRRDFALANIILPAQPNLPKAQFFKLSFGSDE